MNGTLPIFQKKTELRAGDEVWSCTVLSGATPKAWVSRIGVVTPDAQYVDLTSGIGLHRIDPVRHFANEREAAAACVEEIQRIRNRYFELITEVMDRFKEEASDE